MNYKNMLISLVAFSILMLSTQTAFSEIDQNQTNVGGDISDFQTNVDKAIDRRTKENAFRDQDKMEQSQANKGLIFQQELPEKTLKKKVWVKDKDKRKAQRLKEKEKRKQEKIQAKLAKKEKREKRIQEWKDKKYQKRQKAKRRKELRKLSKIKKEKYGEYTLGKDDVINIAVRRHPEFSGQFPIGPNGKIQYPFIGDIKLSGLTKTEARAKLTKVLDEFIESAEVDVAIVAYNSKVVYVLGQVVHPGKYSMRAEFMPVREAVFAAGFHRQDTAALRRAIIIRPLADGSTIIKKVNLLKLVYDGKLQFNYDLRSGDIVYLPSTALYKVTTIMNQVISPFFQSSQAYNVYEEDVLYRDKARRTYR